MNRETPSDQAPVHISDIRPQPAHETASESPATKLATAIRLIREATAESPCLKALDIEPSLASLQQGLNLLILPDSELALADLILKYDWFVGQHLYARARVNDTVGSVFTIMPSQDIPEGVVITGFRPRPGLVQGQVVGLDLEIKRKNLKPSWYIRAVDID